jgi:hypothetical protein
MLGLCWAIKVLKDNEILLYYLSNVYDSCCIKTALIAFNVYFQMMALVFHAVTHRTCVPSSLPNCIMRSDYAKRKTSTHWTTLKLRMWFIYKIDFSWRPHNLCSHSFIQTRVRKPYLLHCLSPNQFLLLIPPPCLSPLVEAGCFNVRLANASVV